ncbi:MAG: YwiC-like family protein [Candidatus Thermoplasmatota archaeon]|nr:YwiC-like family protein [Candidatus Thermoplasmatota archaeon]
MRGVFTLTISKQHGAWSILIACFVLGTWVGGSLDPRTALLLCSVVFGFLARHSAGVYLRFPETDTRRKGVLIWTTFYALVLLGTGGLLVLAYGLWSLLLFGILLLAVGLTSLMIAHQKRDYTNSGELIGVLGLTLVAPVAEYTARGIFSVQTFAVWVLCASFFCGSVFHVRYLVRRRAASMGPLRQRLKAGRPSVLYHLGALCAAVVLGLAGMLPPLSPLALLPGALRAWTAVGRRVKRPLPVRRIGVMEVFYTLVFLVMVVLAFYIS